MSRLLKIRPSSRYSRSSTTPSRGYNQESGLCYSEVTCSGGTMTAAWTWKTTGRLRKHRSHGPGCSSLKNMAIWVAIVNCLSITPETLAEVPWEVAQQLWNRIITSKLDSLHVWKVFASAYPDEREITLKCKKLVILVPTMGLTHYITHLISPSFRWVTFLTLSNITCSRTDLVHLSQSTNLGILNIGKGFKANNTGLDDSMIRTWMRAVVENNAFSMLHVLNCSYQREVTAKSFNYLAHFPSLAIINFAHCSVSRRDTPEALNWGWNYDTGKDLRNFVLNTLTTCSGFNSMNHACFRPNGKSSPPTLTTEDVESINTLPVLHCSLGASFLSTPMDMGGDQNMMSFQRQTSSPAALEAAKGPKRPGVYVSRLNCSSRKKPMMRASKQQDMGVLLTGFGS